MLNLKKLLTQIINKLNALTTLNTLSISRVISTTYMNDTQFNRIKAYKKYGMLHLVFNAEFTSTGYNASSDFQTIATINGWQTKYDTIMAIPNQMDSTKILTLQITYNGNIKVYSTKAISGWYRTSVCIPSTT